MLSRMRLQRYLSSSFLRTEAKTTVFVDDEPISLNDETSEQTPVNIHEDVRDVEKHFATSLSPKRFIIITDEDSCKCIEDRQSRRWNLAHFTMTDE